MQSAQRNPLRTLRPVWLQASYGRIRAEPVEHRLEFRGNIGGFAVLDIAALDHVDELAIAQKCDRGRRRQVSGEIAAGAFGGFPVLTGEYGKHALRTVAVLQGQTDRGTHAPGGAP